jgi:peroxiredoxin Q/BCP
VTQLAPGDKAPDFTLTAADGSTVSLADFRGRHLVLYFYTGGHDPGVHDAGLRLPRQPGLAPGRRVRRRRGLARTSRELAAFVERDGLTFPLLSDPGRETLEAYGAWGERSMYGKKVTGVIRSTVVVDPEGAVQLARYNVKATGHVASLRKALGV